MNHCLFTVAALCIALASGCSSGDGAGTSDDASAAASAQAATPGYDLHDRETFMAQAPECGDYEGWFTEFPADTDLDFVLGHVQECGGLPAHFLDHPDQIPSGDRLVHALLDPSVDDPGHRVAYVALAEHACEYFSSGDRSLWQLDVELSETYGAQPAHYRAAIDLAVRLCPRHRQDLTLFSTNDPSRETTALRTWARQQWPNDMPPIIGDSEVSALAAVVCTDLRDGTSIDEAALLPDTMTGGHGVTFVTRAAERFCPENL